MLAHQEGLSSGQNQNDVITSRPAVFLTDSVLSPGLHDAQASPLPKAYSIAQQSVITAGQD
jgi:hypothetical protein